MLATYSRWATATLPVSRNTRNRSGDGVKRKLRRDILTAVIVLTAVVAALIVVGLLA
jgi:hypothetical protein